MHLVTMSKSTGYSCDYGLRVGPWVHANVIAFKSSNERLGHAVGPWAADWGRALDQPDVAGKGAGVSSGVTAAVIRQPLDRLAAYQMRWYDI